MKKLLFSLSLLASLATIAGESSVEVTAQVFGTLPVTTSASNIIVSVPWVATGYDNGEIAVSNIIKTAGLTEGDTLKTFSLSKGAFNVWELKKNSENVLYWSGVTVVTTNGQEKSEAADITTLARGKAMILSRSKNWDGSQYRFQLFGQYTNGESQVTITPGTAKQPSYTLIAPPGTTAVDLNKSTDVTWSGTINNGASTGDIIVYGETSGMGTAVYRKSVTSSGNNQWGYMSAAGWVDAPVIQPGKGVWYVSRGGSPTITFK